MAYADRFDAVVFDLDGTLLETAPDLCRALNHALALAGRPTVAVAELRRMVGDGARALLKRGLTHAGGEPSPEEIERWLPVLLDYYGNHLADESRPFPEAAATLDKLRASGARLAICTNKPHHLTEELLRLLDLRDQFDAVLGGDSLPVRKPDPGHLLGTLEALGVPPERAAMVGDSINDVAAARSAGVPVVVVSFGYTAIPAAQLGADAVIDSFAELPAALARLA